MTASAGDSARSRARGAWRPPLLWLVDALSLALAVGSRAARPGTWRAPVRARFLVALDRLGVRSIPAVAVAGLISGLLVIGQGANLLRELGDNDLMRELLTDLLIRDLAPLMIMLVLLARSGFALSAELTALDDGGQIRALRAVGVDPLALLVLPPVLAGTIAAVALTLLFSLLAAAAGIAVSVWLGLTAFHAGLLPSQILSGLAASALPFTLSKAAAMTAFALAVVATTALEPRPSGRGDGALAHGFFRAVLGGGLIALLLELWR